MTTYDIDPRTQGRVRFASALRGHGDRPALITADGAVSYAHLADLVDARAERLGRDVRRLVLLNGHNDLETVVTWLAALHAGHALWLSAPGPDGQRDALERTYRPDVVVSSTDGSLLIEDRSSGSDHVLHPDLALLLSTSGSTGAARLVRLSAENAQSNADAIATFLDIRNDDRAITTLPLHYCYGLSVLSSHLARGASVVLTDLSVVDSCFWDLARRAGATSLAGVPHTFELLDRIGFTGEELPTLRTVTQAGGRMPADDVVRWSRLGGRNGWRLFVMYGQTEATARMTYLPPELATSCPASIGRPIDGGSIELQPCAEASEPGVGEIVYRGPNVMLGYAESPADLALGRTVDELRTGDLGRRSGDGMYEVVGRRSRVLKLFGLRIDLHQVERILSSAGVDATCAGSDDVGLVVAVEAPADTAAIGAVLVQELALPTGAVHVIEVDSVPRLSNGKPDYVAITDRARAHSTAVPSVAGPRRSRRTARRQESVEDVFRDVLGTETIGHDDTFVSLGGDSLSYVEASIRLEQILGHTPPAWHVTPVGELSQLTPRHRRITSVETSVLVRAAAIALVVGSHMHVFWLRGGAHVLLAVAGFNFARFELDRRESRLRPATAARTIARIAAPASLWIGLQMLLAGGYSLGSLLLVNNYTGDSHRRGGRWEYWYIEVLVQILLVLFALRSIRAVRDAERRRPFAFAACLLALTLVARFGVVQFGDPYNYLFRTHTVAWFFVLGWAMHRAATLSQRVLLSGATIIAVHGFFEEPGRDLLVTGGLLLLLWVPVIPVPRPVDRLAGCLAAASMFIYLTHWQVWPHMLREFVPWAALPLTLSVGVAAWWLVGRVQVWVRAVRGSGELPFPARSWPSPKAGLQ